MAKQLRWHVSDEGRVLPCSAVHADTCIYSQREDGATRHFDLNDETSAEKKASSLLEKRYSKFGTTRKKATVLPERIKNKNRPGSLSIDEIADLSLGENRFGVLKPDTISEEHFSDFLKECETSVKA